MVKIINKFKQMRIMKKMMNYCKKAWLNAVAFNTFSPTGMIPNNYTI